MAGRPRQVSDEGLMAAVAYVVREAGPAGVTLAAVGRRANLSAAALNQRYGSKDAMQSAFVEFITHRLNTVFADAPGEDPLCELHAALRDLLHGIETPEHMANYVAMLHHDLADPVHRETMVGYRQALRDQVFRLLCNARKQDMLRLPDDVSIDDLSETLVAAFEGATISWATDGRGPVAEHVWRVVRRVLRPWLV